VGKTVKDQREWERKQGGKPRRELDEDYGRKIRHLRLDDITLEEEDLDDYSEHDLDYYE